MNFTRFASFAALAFYLLSSGFLSASQNLDVDAVTDQSALPILLRPAQRDAALMEVQEARAMLAQQAVQMDEIRNRLNAQEQRFAVSTRWKWIIGGTIVATAAVATYVVMDWMTDTIAREDALREHHEQLAGSFGELTKRIGEAASRIEELEELAATSQRNASTLAWVVDEVKDGLTGTISRIEELVATTQQNANVLKDACVSLCQAMLHQHNTGGNKHTHSTSRVWTDVQCASKCGK